ncbi:hypothetical protein ACFL57_04245 [Candidatus Margulisiibacteriota bacterium]
MKNIITVLLVLFSYTAIFAADGTPPNNNNTSFWIEHLIKLFYIAITALLAYRFGIRKYLHQRGHELVTKRYLENGVDLVATGVEHALSVWRDNYAHSLRILKNFRVKQKHGFKMDQSEYDGTMFRRYNQDLFEFTPFYKLKTIIGDTEDIFHKLIQSLFAFVEITANYCQYVMCVAIKEFTEGDKIKITAEDLSNENLKIINEYHEKFSKYYILIQQLHKITWILETNPMLLKDMKKIKDREDIKECISHLKETFKDDLEEISELISSPDSSAPPSST